MATSSAQRRLDLASMMVALPSAGIVNTGWDALEARRQKASRSSTRAAARDQALQEYFGDDQYQYLQRLAEQATPMRSRTPVLGNVVLLSAIMGSSLTTIDVSDVAERLRRSSTRQEQEQYGRLLNTYLIPEELHPMIDDDKSLTLILDRSTAAFPFCGPWGL